VSQFYPADDGVQVELSTQCLHCASWALQGLSNIVFSYEWLSSESFAPRSTIKLRAKDTADTDSAADWTEGDDSMRGESSMSRAMRVTWWWVLAFSGCVINMYVYCGSVSAKRLQLFSY